MERKESGAGREWKKIEDKLNYWKTTLSYFDDEGTLFDNTILSLTQEGQERWNPRPHHTLVGEVRSLLYSERRQYEAQYTNDSLPPFDPIEWVSKRFTPLIFTNNTDLNDPKPASIVNRPILDLCRAFESISIPYIKNGDYRAIVSGLLTSEAASRKSSVIHLKPDAVRLLDAIVDAVGIPHTRGESAIDLLTHVPTSTPTPPRALEDKYVRLRGGELIEREFSGDSYPPTMRVVFVGDVRFTRGIDGVFRADSDDVVRAQEEESLHSIRNIMEVEELLKTYQQDTSQSHSNTGYEDRRTIIIDGQGGLFSPTPRFRLIKGKNVNIDGRAGWFYPYPLRKPVDPAFSAAFDSLLQTTNHKPVTEKLIAE